MMGDHFLRLSVKKSPFHYSVRPILIDVGRALPAAWAAGREIFSFPETQNLKHERGRAGGRGWGTLGILVTCVRVLSLVSTVSTLSK